jgi:aspartyl-tRNA(Asn)/glutamyl-tRNA(Gln) amidotransferase subunit C
MKLTDKDLDHLANLAKLELTKPEKQLYLKQLAGILDFVEKLKEVKLKTGKISDKENTYHLREDQAIVFDNQKEIIEQFSEKKNNLLKTASIFNRK